MNGEPRPRARSRWVLLLLLVPTRWRRQVDTMRLVLCLDAPAVGTVTVCGRGYREQRRPLRQTDAGVLADRALTTRSAGGDVFHISGARRRRAGSDGRSLAVAVAASGRSLTSSASAM